MQCSDACVRAPVLQGKDVPLFVTADGRSYDAHKQWSIYCESQAAWYLTVILCQFWCGA